MPDLYVGGAADLLNKPTCYAHVFDPPTPDGFRFPCQKKEHKMKDLVFTQNGQVLTDSLTVAETFGKDHKDVLRAINSIDCEASFKQRNFAPLEGTYINGIGVECKRPVYNLTKDGFVLLVMGFTGKKAMAFKIKYIEAFNAMERALAAPVPALDAKAIGGIVKKCAAKAVKDELAALPAPSFNPQALVEALEKARREEEGHRCIGMAVSPQEKQILQLIRDDYFIAVGKVYRAALDAIEQ